MIATRPLKIAVLMLVLSAVSLSVRAPAQAMELVIAYCASSMQPVIDTLLPALEERDLGLTPVYGGSSTLARQIELGAPGVGIYISANSQWMDHLEKQGLLEPGTRQAIATNRLALIASKPLPAPMMVFGPGYPLHAVLGDGRLAIANPDHVPAGQYAKEALQNLGMWDRVKDKLAPTKDVTGALMLVARGEAKLGVVYLSDVQRVEGLHVFQTLPAESHSPIVYWAALLKGQATDRLRGFLDILTGAQGQAAFRTAGFGPKP